MLHSLRIKQEKRDVVLPSKVLLNFVVVYKNKGSIAAVDKKKFRFIVGKWGEEGEIGRITFGNNKGNKIVLDCDNISSNQGFVKVEINDFGVLSFYYQDTSRYGTVFNNRILHKNGVYLRNHSALYFGNLLNGRSCEVVFDYSFLG